MLKLAQTSTSRFLATGALAFTLAAVGCHDPRYTGAGVGAAAGAGVGAAIGAGVGALVGYVAGDQLGQRDDGTDYPANFHRHGEFEHTHPHRGPHEHDADGNIVYPEQPYAP